MKTVFKKMLSLVLVALLLVSAVPFQASAAGETYTITFRIKNSADGSNIETQEFVAVAGDEVYVGAIVSGKYGYEVTSFAAGGTTYEADESFVPTGDTTVAVYVNVAEENEEEEEVKEEEKEEEKPAAKKTLKVTVYVVDLNGNADQYGEPVVLEGESFTLNEALAREVYKGHANFDYKWQGNVEDGEVNLLVFPIKTENNKKIITLKLMHNDGSDDYDTITMLAGKKILKAINDAKISLSRNGYYLAGWSFDMNCSDDINRDDVANEDMTIYAEWEKKSTAGSDQNEFDGETDVLLRIYLNEYTRSVDRVVNMNEQAKNGRVSIEEVTAVVKKYYKQAYSNDDMDIEGLFTYDTWNSGNYDMDDAENKIYVNDNGEDTIIYVMVRDAKRVSSGSADTSNPKTGDAIFMAVTIMATSAAALIYVFNKKRAVK